MNSKNEEKNCYKKLTYVDVATPFTSTYAFIVVVRKNKQGLSCR